MYNIVQNSTLRWSPRTIYSTFYNIVRPYNHWTREPNFIVVCATTIPKKKKLKMYSFCRYPKETICFFPFFYRVFTRCDRQQIPAPLAQFLTYEKNASTFTSSLLILSQRGRIHQSGSITLAFGCAVWVCVSLSPAFSMSFSVTKTKKWRQKRMRQSNAHPKGKYNQPLTVKS
jgi:hypothetical protein